MGSAGLPALSGFIGEFLTIFGTFISGDQLPQGYSLPNCRALGALAATGVILGAIYLLYMFQKVFFGKLDKARNGKLPDLKVHELITFVILSVAIILGGLFPRPALALMEPSVQKFVRGFGRRVGEPNAPAHVYGSLPAANTPTPTPTPSAPPAPPPGAPAPGGTP
jgi:NADH-quinone oxidoreductase subunit M